MGVIINKKDLESGSALRKKALSILDAGLESIVVKKVIREKIKVSRDGGIRIFDINGKERLKINRKDIDNLYVVGIGKASANVVNYIVDVLGNYVDKAMALDVENNKSPNTKINKKVETIYGTHPLPSEKNVLATNKILKLIKNAGENDFIIYFIGGGGSSLFCASDYERKYGKDIFEKLTKKGATIEEINTIRKHISLVKGGWLARHTYPARFISLIASDVPGDDIGFIASGPTVLDKTTLSDAKSILKKYGIGASKIELMETPKDRKYFSGSKNILIVSNVTALKAMKDKAKNLGFNSKIYSSKHCMEAKKSLASLVNVVKRNQVIIAGGESTVKLSKNHGVGGRNLEAVLGVLNGAYNAEINLSDLVAISLASDGKDFVPVAGAIADAITMKNVIQKNLDPKKYLERNNSYNFFKKIGSIIETEKTTFNVSDLMIVLRSYN